MAAAAPVTYDFEGYITFRGKWWGLVETIHSLPPDVVPGTKFTGTMTFDPTVTEFDAIDNRDVHRPVMTLQLRTAAGEVFANTQVTQSELEGVGAASDRTFLEVPTAEQPAPTGSYFADLLWSWSNSGTGQVPANISTLDPALLAPNFWPLTINTYNFNRPAASAAARGPVTQGEGPFDDEVENETVYASITALWRRNQPPSLYSQGFGSTPPRWVNRGGAWSAVSGVYENAANVAFTSSVYNGLALRDNFGLTARLFSRWPGGANTLGLVFNYQDSANFYEVRFNPLGTATLNKVANGTRTMLDTASYPGAPQTAFDVNVRRNANRIRVTAANTPLFDLTDTDHVGGYAGVFTSWNKGRFDNFRVSQPTAWNVSASTFAANANGWTPASGTWSVQGGYYRSGAIQASSISLSNAFTTNDYGIDAQIYMEWSGAANRGGLVYDYQNARNYRAIVITPLKAVPTTERREGLVEVVEVRNGVRTVLVNEACSVPGANFDNPNNISQWRPIGVSRVAGLTRVRCATTILELRQPIIGGARRVGMMTNWAPIRFDDVVLATQAVN